MKTLILTVFFLFLFGSTVPPAAADSPLTSTPFHPHYDQDAVAAARGGRMTTQVLNFLLGRAPTDQKAACVNALSWQKDATGNAQAFVRALEGRHRKQGRALTPAALSTDELLVLGYLLALHDYFKFEPLEKAKGGLWAARPAELLAEAQKRAPEDFTIALVAALIAVQNTPDADWCQVYAKVQAVLDRFPETGRNLKPAAVKAVMAYIGEYKKYCPLPAGQLAPGFLEAYELVAFDGGLAVGTQAGVALWELRKHQLMSVHPRGITTSLAVVGGRLWAGSAGAVGRYDGKTWKDYLKLDPKRHAGTYRLVVDNQGVLHVFRNKKWWRYDAKGDRFTEAALDWDPYHAAFSPSGELWGVDFLKGLRRQVAGSWLDYARKGPRYPGSDPRRVVVDANKRLWVMDFTDGFFRFDPAADAFVSAGPKVDKAFDLRVDVARGRTWYLHYTKGVTLEEGGKTREFDLSAQKYMRCLHLTSGGDLYVGGQTALVQITKEKGAWVVHNHTHAKAP